MTKVILPTLIFNKQLSIEEQVATIKKLGADGIEIRRERLENISEDLRLFKQELEMAVFDAVIYSVPIELWQDPFSLNPDAIRALKEAEFLNATHIKFSLGKFDAKHADAKEFKEWIASNLPSSIKMLVENDQTPYGGTLDSILSFFQWQTETSVSMTFDVGNWTVQNENWSAAHLELSTWIEYLHLKTAAKTIDGWVNKPVDHDLLKLPYPAYTAIEFPLDNPQVEAPQWLEMIRKENS
ncbi:sugar phosphate isomerase/epimerase family protein [Bacillus mesophilum]|uniref:Xylose isomerase n=1 Tax=Bacillus mesophilum TaxID=1071718 RepID=A0A7V7RJG9_9BACI|nr:hypothetical protein [Bacillus mesophilum]KAB2331000.1 hypothetical protein F7732_17475 [Bacillus mesophilum]